MEILVTSLALSQEPSCWDNWNQLVPWKLTWLTQTDHEDDMCLFEFCILIFSLIYLLKSTFYPQINLFVCSHFSSYLFIIIKQKIREVKLTILVSIVTWVCICTTWENNNGFYSTNWVDLFLGITVFFFGRFLSIRPFIGD